MTRRVRTTSTAKQLRQSLFALCLLGLGGCLGQTGRFEQALAKVDRIETRVGTIETTLENNQSQGQQGLINIATMGPGIGGYALALLLILVVWKLWRRMAYWKNATTQTIEAIEEQKGYTQGVRQRLAKAHAKMTPFGKLVTATTRRTPACSTSASNNSSSTHAA